MIGALGIGLMALAAWFREDRLRMERERELRWAVMGKMHQWERLQQERHTAMEAYYHDARLIEREHAEGRIHEAMMKEAINLRWLEYQEQVRAIIERLDTLDAPAAQVKPRYDDDMKNWKG